jgi:sulfatase maturation enzyme AslB (radical SAM superfamily)
MPNNFKEQFFCPAPWTHMYYHIDNTTPCHLIRNDSKLSPEQYLKSEWLLNLKQEFIDGKVPRVCGGCKTREDLGLRSTRDAFWKIHKLYDGDTSVYTTERKTAPRRFEIRLSNLCNFKCRMCSEDSSSEIVKENKKFRIPTTYRLLESNENGIYNSPEENLEEIKSICLGEGLESVVFTGGEPLLAKGFYEIMDFMIEKGLNETISLELFTNCSVYNPEFVNRMLKFKTVNFVMSIDGVEKTAEYQRHGTDWNVVKSNILKFNGMPINRLFNTAISGYVVLDASRLATFLMELYQQNNGIITRCYSVAVGNDCHWQYMAKHLREKAIIEIDKAIEILSVDNFARLVGEFKNIKKVLQTTEPINTNRFNIFTRKLDMMRGESFEDTFGIQLLE